MADAFGYETTRRTLQRALAGSGRLTWVHEPRSPLAVTLWPFSQVLHAFALSDAVSGPGRFAGLARGLKAYRHPQGCFRESVGRGQRYYDDNAWVGLALLQHDVFAHSGDWRGKASQVDEFVRTGFDPDTGGIRWVEGGDTVNACSTGAGAVLHAHLGHPIEAELRFLAELRNADGLVRDHLRADGTVEPSVYSYNQGLLIIAALKSGNHRLAAEAAEAGNAHFTVERLWEQPVSFNAVYVRAQLQYGKFDHVHDYVQRLVAQGRDDHGWYTLAGRYDEGRVLDTAAALQMLTVIRFPHLAAVTV